MNMMTRLRVALMASASLFITLTAAAVYPEKPIRIILPYPPGGGGDLVLRTIQPMLEKQLGQSIIVDYRSGAAGNIGAREVVNATPDGYTLVMGATNNFVINQFLFPKMGFDPLQDFAPISLVVEQPYLVMISGQVPANNFSEFSNYAKANSSKMNFGSPGAGTVPHISAQMLSDHMGLKMHHVPYRGSQPGLLALAGDEVQLFIASYSIVAGQMGAGKIRPIAVAAQRRLEALPDVPTAAEVGLPAGVLLGNWWGLAAPRGTNSAIISRLAREIQAIMKDPKLQQKLVEQGSIPIASLPDEFAKRMSLEARQWKAIIDKTGIKPDN